MTRKLPVWNVAIDYRLFSVDCVHFSVVRAQTEEEAIEKGKTKLRRQKGRRQPIIWRNARAELSGWNR